VLQDEDGIGAAEAEAVREHALQLRIVDAPAHVVPPLRTSQGALEMMVTEPAEAAPAGQASGPASP
jgi:hypothetical protein